MKALAWTILGFVFLDELASMAALGVWGASVPPRWLWIWAAPLAAMVAWSLVASPRAAYGGPVRRPVAKVLVFGLATLGLWSAGHPDWAAALLVVSVAVNALAVLPTVRQHVPQAG